MKSFPPSNLVRELSWRAGRKLYCYARNEQPNNPFTNGEYWLFRQYVSLCSNEGAVFDIGANKGEWTQNAFEVLCDAGKSLPIHVFEPTTAAFESLKGRFGDNNDIHLINMAVTKKSGKREIFVVKSLSGLNSLYPAAGSIPETVATNSVDEYCVSHEIHHLGFVKSDVEGFEIEVLLGAQDTFDEARCDIWQFEYNHRWINSRTFLKDVFDFIEDKPYRFGKLYGNGIDIYEHWHPELERYFECNCVLIKKGCPVERIGKQVMITKANAGRRYE